MASYEEEELHHDPSEETLTIEARFQPLLTETMTKSKDGFLGVSEGKGGTPDIKTARVHLLPRTGLCPLPHPCQCPSVPTASKKLSLLPSSVWWESQRKLQEPLCTQGSLGELPGRGDN